MLAETRWGHDGCLARSLYNPFENKITLEWQRFQSIVAARGAFAWASCIYVQADSEGRALRVRGAPGGLAPLYRGETGRALDAAMHGSGNLVFVAAVSRDVCEAVEGTLLWIHRDVLPYNAAATPPSILLELNHLGSPPRFEV